MAAAAALVAAATVVGLREVLGFRHTAKLKGHADILADSLLDRLQFALGIKKVAGNLVFEKRITGGLELTDLRGTELDAGMLLVMKLLTSLVDALILKARGIVIEEPLDLSLELLETGLGHDLGAEFFGLRDHRRVIC